MASKSDKRKKRSAESPTRQSKQRKISTKTTKSRIEFFMGMANQIFLNQVEEGSNKNFALSPVSIDVTLSMVAAGSRGPTLERYLALLGMQDMDEIKANASAVMAAMRGERSDKCGDGPVLCMVNGAWVDNRFPLVPSYKKDVLKGIYGCDAKTVDFLHQANEVVNKVNSWAEDASKGLIKSLMQPGSLSPKTAIILANGLYFKGIWTRDHRFDASLTKKRDFYLLNGDTISVPFIKGHTEYEYGSFDGFKVLKIPYNSAKLGRKFSMYFFLPHEKVGLQNLLQELHSDSGFSNQYYFNLNEVRLKEVWIPKFDFSYEIDIPEIMNEMGMTFPSIGNPEDLSVMMKIGKGTPSFATTMIQKVVVKVGEKGTEAAAATYAAGILCGLKRYKDPTKNFIADHPFIFMIREEKSGLVFFTGAVLNPNV